MDLILWRHAEAEPHVPRGDLARALTAKGEKQAMQMAAWLNARLDADTRVLASPAVRCQQTAKALGRAIRTVETIAPDVPGQNVLDAAGWPDGDGTVVVVGHQPTLGIAAALALTSRADAWPVKKAAAWWIQGGAGGAELVAVQVPALL